MAVERDTAVKPSEGLLAGTPAAVVSLPPPKLTLKQRLRLIFKDYPKVAIITYLSLSAIAIIGFSIAIGVGAHPSTATGVIGVIGAGWLAAKVTVPLRIIVTLAITPPIAAALHRWWPSKPEELPLDDDDDDDDDD